MSAEYSSLAEIAEVIDSLHKTPSYASEGFPMVRVTDVKYGTLNLSNTFLVDEATYSEFSRRYKPSLGDVVITRVGTYGVTARVGEAMFCLGQNTAAIIPKSIDSRYLYAALNSEFVRAQIEAGVVGSTQKTLSLKHIKALMIPRLGSFNEAEIAETIGALDDRITLLRETNATLEAIAQALFKSWFVDFDPVRAKMEGRAPEGMDEATAALFPDALEESELGWVPKGWRVGTLADVATLNAQSLLARNPPPEINYIDLAGVKANVFDVPQCYSFADAPSRARRVLHEGDCIVGTVRPGNRSFGFIATAQNHLTGSTGFAVLSPKQCWMTAFTYLCATRDESIDRLAALADGGAYPAVRPEVVASTPCALPTDEVMKAFDSISRQLLKAIGGNSEQAQTLATLRDTLLP
ncbi:MAG: restriction endonuclease subunit S, partial [Xylophilus sp.]|nr:restriction endonuclease subunit S [Xylophilus sp.]